jgi:hypothetical protein
MKTILLILLVFTIRVFPQGVVQFVNTTSTRLTTNDLHGNVGFTTGVNAYRIGLYIAPQGTTDPNVFSLMNPTAVNRTGSGGDGQTIAFQVRAWSYYAGSTYEEAVLYAGPGTVYRGSSTIGQVIPAIGSATPPALFGTQPEHIGGFTLTPIIPEPSTGALVVLGAAVLWFVTRARRRKSFPPPSRTPE